MPQRRSAGRGKYKQGGNEESGFDFHEHTMVLDFLKVKFEFESKYPPAKPGALVC
jgi:hypothetical protein